MRIVNYPKQYCIFRFLISIGCLLCKHKPTIVVWETCGIYEFLTGIFSGNTHTKCARVHEGTRIVYFGSYMYQQYVCSVVV